jgi:parallel beta-helix repeat protein
MPRSGVGIHVLPGAGGILVEGEAEGVSEEPAANLCGWNYGAESDGYSVYWRQLGFTQNGIGLFLNQAESNTTSEIAASNNITGVRVLGGFGNLVARADAENNAHYGFWIDGTKGNTFSQNIYNDNNALSNGIAGFYVGCSATGDVKSTAPCTNADNTLNGNLVEYNRFYGIAVERGSVGNLIENNTVIGQDPNIIDGNGTCKDNTYRHNGAPCVH